MNTGAAAGGVSQDGVYLHVACRGFEWGLNLYMSFVASLPHGSRREVGHIRHLVGVRGLRCDVSPSNSHISASNMPLVESRQLWWPASTRPPA